MKETPSISLPPGVRDILPEEADRIKSVERRILDVFEGHGFSRVFTPLLEYLDVLSLGMGEGLKDKVLKFVDPSTGRLVAIRPDITPQVARLAATRMRSAPLPLKICYNEGVIRNCRPGENREREILQIGAEYISKARSNEADGLMICMAIEGLLAAGVKDFKLDIGDVGFLRSVFDSLKLREKELAPVKDAVARKDSSGLDAAIAGLGGKISGRQRKTLLELTSFYGEEEVIDRAYGFASGAGKASLDNLKAVWRIIARRGYRAHVTIDLGEVRGFDYYTGIIFEGFAKGFGKSILSGGRYDTLLERYGYKAAAIGFAFDIETLVDALEKRR